MYGGSVHLTPVAEANIETRFKKTSSLCWLPLVLSLALLVRIATRVTLVEASRVSVCGLLLAHVRCMLNKHLLEC